MNFDDNYRKNAAGFICQIEYNNEFRLRDDREHAFIFFYIGELLICKSGRLCILKTITIMVPCYNEAEALPFFFLKVNEVINTIKKYKFSFLFIDDGSLDDTLAQIKKLQIDNTNVSYISLSRNFGKEAAMMAGIDYVEGDAMIIMDADLQHPPEMIVDFINWWEQGYQDVCGKRIDRTDESFVKRTMAKWFYRILQKTSRYKIQQNVGDFRLLDKKCILALRKIREKQRFTKGLFTWIGFRKKELLFHVQPRVAGRTAWDYHALYNLAIEGITSFSVLPLKVTTILGLGVSAVSIGYMFFVLCQALIYGDPVAGYPTMMVVILLLGGVQLLSLGIIGEYLGRSFIENKNRPIYIVNECSEKISLDKGEAE